MCVCVCVNSIFALSGACGQVIISSLDSVSYMYVHVYLVVSGWISDDEKAWLPKSFLDLIGEGSRGESASHWSGTSVVGKLQHSSLDNERYDAFIRILCH